MGFLAALASLIAPLQAWTADDFLRPEEAYRYTARFDGERLIVRWTIQPGYYLYKSRMALGSGTPGVTLGDPRWPAGEPHTDEFFGTQDIYRGTVDIPVALSFGTPRPAALDLELRLQGCADAGLCYPPLRWKSQVALTPGPGAAASGAGTPLARDPVPFPASAASSFPAFPGSAANSTPDSTPALTAGASPSKNGLRSLFGSRAATPGVDDFLPPDDAFRFGAGVSGSDTVTLTWIIAEGYYLYKEQIRVAADSPDLQIGPPQLPPGQPKTDESYGDTEVYYDLVEATLPVARRAGPEQPLSLEVSYQGCAEGGLCYNPISKTVSLTLPAATADRPLPAAASLQASAASRADPARDADLPVAEQDRLAQLIRDGNLFAVLATFFGLGILLSLTPCVLPMIPILSGIIVGQGGKVTPLKGFSLAFTYVQGMALTYAIAGAAFVLAFRQAPQAFFQQPWIIVTFAVLFVALALAMFGAYTLQLPSALQTRLAAISDRQRSGTWIGTFIMGALSALIVTACVAPAIIAALSVISQTGQIARGAGALYATGLGMGVPLLIVGASAGSLLPKVGPWMDAVKSLFGVLFLGVAIYLLNPLLPGTLMLLLWATLAIMTGFWMFSLKGRDGSPIAAPVRGVGLIALVYGMLLLIGAASGSRDPLQPLDRLSLGAGAAAAHELVFQRIKTVDDLERAIASAGAAGRGVMLDFYADWCVSCKEMEKYTFTDPGVRAALADVVLLQADVTANDVHDQALMERFGIFGPPTLAFFGADGLERKGYRLVGFVPAARFHRHVTAAFSR